MKAIHLFDWKGLGQAAPLLNPISGLTDTEEGSLAGVTSFVEFFCGPGSLEMGEHSSFCNIFSLCWSCCCYNKVNLLFQRSLFLVISGATNRTFTHLFCFDYGLNKVFFFISSQSVVLQNIVFCHVKEVGVLCMETFFFTTQL